MRLQYTEMPQIIQFLAGIHARSSGKEKQNILSGLNPSETALFFGVNEQPMCSAREREQYCRYIRRTLKKLLKTGVNTVIVETSTLFGYYTLNELIRQRDKHHFSLLAIQCEGNRYHWMQTNDEQAEERAWRNIHNFIFCDNIISPLDQDEWLRLLSSRVCPAFMEQPYCIRNIGILPQKEFNKWGPPLTEELAQKILRSMRRKDEEEAAEC